MEIISRYNQYNLIIKDSFIFQILLSLNQLKQYVTEHVLLPFWPLWVVLIILKEVFIADCTWREPWNPECLSYLKSETTCVARWISILNIYCIYSFWCSYNTDQIWFKLRRWYVTSSTAWEVTCDDPPPPPPPHTKSSLNMSRDL